MREVSFYQIQMRFNSLEHQVTEMHAELIILQQKMANMEHEHLEELEHHAEELEIENKNLLQRLGIKRP